MLIRLLFMLLVASNIEQAAVNLWMQCLDASLENLRRARELRNPGRVHTFGLQGTGRSTCRENFNAQALQFAGKINDTGLVRN